MVETASSTSPRPGLRERKKQRTRRTIVDVAVRLFAEQGYDGTTLVQIADEAEIAPSTFFNYFPSKVDIVFALFDAVIDSARGRILERPAAEDATHAVLAWVEEDLHEVEAPYSEALRQIPRIVASVPELQAEERLRLARLEDLFAAAYARDLGETAEGMRSRVMATIALRALVDVWAAWYEQNADSPDFDLSRVIAIKAEYLERVLTAGLAAAEALPPPPA
jgi:AcrR family transcriptional regulator